MVLHLILRAILRGLLRSGLGLVALACTQTPPTPSLATTGPTVAAPSPTGPATATANEDVVPIECRPPPVVAPDAVSKSAVAVARGVRFVVLMEPAQLWTGKRRHTFTVMGSTVVPLHGRLVLPELLLEPIGACAS